MMRHGLALRSSKYMLHNATRKNSFSSSSSCHHQLGASHHHQAARPSSSILATAFHSRKIHIQPLPVPAVAVYDFDACDFHDEIGSHDYSDGSCVDGESQQHDQMILASAASGGGHVGNLSTGSGRVGDGSSNRFVRRSSGGGNGSSGGGGIHQCPKCGANVTFHESSNDVSGNQTNGSAPANCFYCAACSGWFLIPPNNNSNNNKNNNINANHDDQMSTITAAQSKYLMSKLAAAAGGGGGGDDNKATGFPTTPSNRKISQSQFVMQHVSVHCI